MASKSKSRRCGLRRLLGLADKQDRGQVPDFDPSLASTSKQSDVTSQTVVHAECGPMTLAESSPNVHCFEQPQRSSSTMIQSSILPVRSSVAEDGSPFEPSSMSKACSEPSVSAMDTKNESGTLASHTGQNPVHSQAAKHTDTQESSRLKTSLWDEAYDALQAQDPDLVKRYESLLEIEFPRPIAQTSLSDQTNHSLNTFSISPSLRSSTRVAQLNASLEQGIKLSELKGKIFFGSHSVSIRDILSKLGSVITFANEWINDAVKASPEASIAWSIICLGLPLLTIPGTAASDQSDGLSYVSTRMKYYLAMEDVFLPKVVDTISAGTQENIRSRIVDLYQQIIAYQIKSIVRYHRSTVKTIADDIRKKNDWEGMLKDLQTDEESFQKDLLVKSSLETQELMEILNREAKNLHQTMEELLATNKQLLIVNEQHLQVSGKILAVETETEETMKQILEQLRRDEQECMQALCPELHYVDVLEQTVDAVEGTCKWFLNQDEYAAWLASSSGSLLISADPGCGKSVLAKLLIKKELPRVCHGTNICYYFFKDAIRNRLGPAISAILHQLASADATVLKHATERFKRDGKNMISSVEALWDVLLCSIRDSKTYPAVIVLDALDEADPKDCGRLLRLLDRANESSTRLTMKTKFLLTSRGYSSIVSSYQSPRDVFRLHIPGEKKSEAISDEVKLVIDYRLKQLHDKGRIDNELEKILRKKFDSDVQRTYLYVYLIFDELENSPKMIPTMTQKELKRFLEKLPKNIDEIYDRMLQRYNDPEIRRQLHQVLCAMLVANEPLSIGQVQCIAKLELSPRTVSHDDLDLQDEDQFAIRLSEWCGLFLQVHHGKVIFLHQTAREFLLARSLSFEQPASRVMIWKGFVTIEQANMCMAQVCITYLLFSEFDTISLKRTSEYTGLSTRVIYSLMRAMSSEEPLLHHASRWWIQYFDAGHCENDAELFKLALTLFDTTSERFKVWTIAFGRYDNPTTPEMVAARSPSVFLLEALLENVDLEMHRRFNKDIVVIAAEYRFAKNVSLLLSKGEDATHEGEDGTTPLHWACINDMYDMVVDLIMHGADVNVLGELKVLPIAFAIRKMNFRIIDLLFKAGTRTSLLIQSDVWRNPPWSRAGKDGLKIALLLLKNMYSLPRTETFSRPGTLLLKVIEGLGKGNTVSKDREFDLWQALKTALYVPIKTELKCALETLIQYGAEMTIQDAYTSLTLDSVARDVLEILREGDARTTVRNVYDSLDPNAMAHSVISLCRGDLKDTQHSKILDFLPRSRNLSWYRKVVLYSNIWPALMIKESDP